ncbi:MAG TPA: TolC family protein, partial [Candidatus Krumholzibacterium sp.]|nr:TolC family protein [Candidatus Krumholzibacterium sp.]
NLVAGITQPLFNSGSLVAGKNAAWARYERSAADYARTVLRAFAEVESALVAGEKQLERREKNLELLEKAVAVEMIAADRYSRGLTGYMTVLDAMQARFQAEQGLVLSDLSLLLSRVGLHRALGGEWFEDHESEKDEN